MLQCDYRDGEYTYIPFIGPQELWREATVLMNLAMFVPVVVCWILLAALIGQWQ